MKIKYRLLIVVSIYLLVLLLGNFFRDKIETELSPKVFETPTLSIQTFMDDLVRIKIGCYWQNKQVNFLVKDEFENIRHNSSLILSCEGFKFLELQGNPQDYLTDRRYMVELKFDNQTINSGYFYFEKYSSLELIRKEIFSFFHFAVLENRLARGAYTDGQRMLYLATGDNVYGKNYLLSHLTGFMFTVALLLAIDIFIWIIYFIYKPGSKTLGRLN